MHIVSNDGRVKQDFIRSMRAFLMEHFKNDGLKDLDLSQVSKIVDVMAFCFNYIGQDRELHANKTLMSSNKKGQRIFQRYVNLAYKSSAGKLVETLNIMVKT